ncbi:MAG TPA: hypothetical protein VMB47_11375 [Candidatus Aquilonibacter sp.]|nr:hypothetical protein [Candidatus Aquilonibacter sp.]
MSKQTTPADWESRLNGSEPAPRIEHLASAPTAPTATKWSKAAKPQVLSEAEERMTPFQRHEAKQTAHMDDSQRDKSIGQRLTEYRTSTDERKTKWDRNRANESEKPITNKFGDAPSGRVTATGLPFDEKLLAAKAAVEAEQAAKQKATEPIRVSLNAEDQRAIFEAFAQSEPEWYDTDFNRVNLWNFLRDAIENRDRQVTGWNVASLRVCYSALQMHGYFEKPVVQKTRGFQVANESAPKLYVPQKTTATTVIPRNAPMRYTRDANEETEARQLSFDELAAKARANYRKGK